MLSRLALFPHAGAGIKMREGFHATDVPGPVQLGRPNSPGHGDAGRPRMPSRARQIHARRAVALIASPVIAGDSRQSNIGAHHGDVKIIRYAGAARFPANDDDYQMRRLHHQRGVGRPRPHFCASM